MDFLLMIFAGIGAGAILTALLFVIPVAVTGLILGSILLMCGPIIDKLIPMLPKGLAHWLNNPPAA